MKHQRCNLPVRSAMCATCPFRDGVAEEYSTLAPMLIHRSMTEATHICHSTGSNNAFHRRTGKREAICRGARNAQIQLFYALGFLPAPTDAAWNEARIKMGLKPQLRA